MTGTLGRDTWASLWEFEVSRSAGLTGTLGRDTWAFPIGIEVSR